MKGYINRSINIIAHMTNKQVNYGVSEAAT